jgi:hypothetical protein
MINLRYHIVSITAVFLALGIGLALGVTFIDKATVETLHNQVDKMEQTLDDTRSSAAAVRQQLRELRSQEQALSEQAPGQLLRGHLSGVPVVMIAARGVDRDEVQRLQQALTSAGADINGTLWLTDRLDLDKDDEVNDLGKVLGLSTKSPSRLQRALSDRMAVALMQAAAPAEAPPATTTVPPAGGAPSSTTSTTVAREDPELITALRASGFLDFEPAPGSGADTPLLPAGGARYVIVSDGKVVVENEHLLIPMLRAMTAEGVAPVVAAEGTTDPTAGAVDRVQFVGTLRGDKEMNERLSTVDDAESFAGWAATVLAIEDLAREQVGHYGIGQGATRLLPPPLPAS